MKKFICGIIAIILCLSLTACSGPEAITITAKPENSGIKLSFLATFYDNYGAQWLQCEGRTFDIKPNKVKEWAYNTDGGWVSSYSLSSVVSVDIDDKSIESCGSTIIFADSRLTQYDVDIPTETLTDSGNKASISAPSDYRLSDYWDLSWWYLRYFKSKDLNNADTGSKIVVIQSQMGNPICMFMGDEVSWDIPRNLPKTTELLIDGKAVYIHRANFAIIDTELFSN